MRRTGGGGSGAGGTGPRPGAALAVAPGWSPRSLNASWLVAGFDPRDQHPVL